MEANTIERTYIAADLDPNEIQQLKRLERIFSRSHDEKIVLVAYKQQRDPSGNPSDHDDPFPALEMSRTGEQTITERA